MCGSNLLLLCRGEKSEWNNRGSVKWKRRSGSSASTNSLFLYFSLLTRWLPSFWLLLLLLCLPTSSRSPTCISLASHLISSSSLPLPQGIGRASSRPTNTFFVKALSLLVKKVNLASSLVVSHACVLGVKSPLTYEIEFDSISSMSAWERWCVDLRFLKCDSILLANQYEEILKSALSSKEGVAPVWMRGGDDM